MIENMQIPVQMYTDALTQPIIAPVQETLTAKQAYGAGAYFIYRSKLYKTTAAIGQGSPIVLEGSGANATPGGTVMEKMVDELTQGTITKNTTSGTLDQTTCYKKNGVVNVSGRIHSMSGQVANGIMFNIPAGYRPAVQTYASGTAIVNNTYVPILFNIKTDGTVSFYYSNASTDTVSQVYFAASYSVA